MTKTPENVTIKRISWVIWTLMVGSLVLLGSAFLHAWRINQALQEEVAVLGPMLTAAGERQATLQAELTYVKSDTYVEEWSRVHAGMTQPGETLVVAMIPTATPTPTPLPTPTPTPTPTPQYFWQRWWRSLMGETP
ncbi:MAG: hypothetical protein JXA21_20040 [Anaerolineae bacterium]|nr:hypothetical protein [Anaerolineae bacterium]